MLLNELLLAEKVAFLSLSIHAANSNGVIEDEERAMVDAYCKEMEIEYPGDDNIISLDDTIKIFKQSDVRNKKIVLLELSGLLYSDGEYDLEEKDFLVGFAKEIGFSKSEVGVFSDLIIKYMDVLAEINNVMK